MNGFLKTTLAVILGIFIASFLSIFLCVAIIGAIAAGSSGSNPVSSEGVLFLDMEKILIQEQSRESDPLEMLGNPRNPVHVIGIWDAVRALEAAADDPAVKFVYLRAEGMNGTIAGYEELRAALSDFRRSGKAVVAGMRAPGTLNYYLASVADKIYLSSHIGQTYTLNGLGGNLVFFKDLLDACGINVQLIRHGKYKSAGETFVCSSPSKENMEQNQAMISSLWNTIASAIAENRDISVERLNAVIDGLKLGEPQDFLEAGLVDELMTEEQLKLKLAELAGKDKAEDLNLIPFAGYVKSKALSPKSKSTIAVVYADGDIVDGHDDRQVAGDDFAGIISSLRRDTTVKAVVLRVNSPGGSVFASEQIKTEMDLLCEVKPVVASYGGYAASGGYWISNNCEKVFTDATTLTGSIGVFGLIPDFSRAIRDKLHVNVVSVNSNRHSDMLNLTRPLNEAEYKYITSSIETVYEKFVAIVSEGRDLEPGYVDSIGQGRVWTGTDAVSIGLADEVGTLEDAVRWTLLAVSDNAEQAELKNWNVVGYPKQKTSLERMMDMLNETAARSGNPLEGTAYESVAGDALSLLSGFAEGKKDIILAKMPFDMVW